MKLKGKEFEEEMRRMRTDRDNFRSYMKQNYDYHVTEKQQNKKLEVIYSYYFFFFIFYTYI